MANESDLLYDLIKGVSPVERRHIKQTLFFADESGTLMQQIYTATDKLKEYNEAALRKQFKAD